MFAFYGMLASPSYEEKAVVDLGNTNYSVITPRQNFTRKHSADLVARAIRKRLGISAYVNERHDIEIEGLKISIFLLKYYLSYHHGTMLIDTDLSQIGRYLEIKKNLVSKGVESVLSPVTKLRNYSLTVNHESFCNAVLQEFSVHYRDATNSYIQPIIVNEELLSKIPKTLEYHDELKSWNWTFGQTPDFSIEFEKTFSWGHVSKNGLISAITLSPSTIKYENLIGALEDSLEGIKYDPISVSQSISELTLPDIQLIPILNDLKNWIQDSL
ncbi:22783_t:CDS:2 [Dentiscutata erythropus]|uniref:Putative lipoate-protein ligase A n=1 Tax=Dentiscutata erythropus TaxID=1348616 RepID=A0A9N8YVP7_9GLOM|nr:22783_t:CDS:2 [Dentiscutata erythropus]